MVDSDIVRRGRHPDIRGARALEKGVRCVRPSHNPRGRMPSTWHIDMMVPISQVPGPRRMWARPMSRLIPTKIGVLEVLHASPLIGPSRRLHIGAAELRMELALSSPTSYTTSRCLNIRGCRAADEAIALSDPESLWASRPSPRHAMRAAWHHGLVHAAWRCR